MLVKFDNALFLDKANTKNLLLIIGLFELGQHTWFIDAVEENTEIYKKYFKEGEDYHLLFDKSYTNSALITHTNYVIISDASKLQDYYNYLKTPLEILVENKFNDCHFIKAIIKHFGAEPESNENILENALDKGWVAFVHAGGTGEVYKFIEKELKNSSTNLSPRLFAILDSDAKTKEERLDTAKPVKKNIQKLCKENRILETHLHILYKREMENYLPLSLIEKLAQKNGIYEYKNKNKKPFNNFLAAFKKLTDEQKDYFDIENGFNFKEFSIKEASLKEFLKKYQEAHNSNKNNVIKNYSTKLLTSEHKEKKIRIPSSFFFTNNQITEKDKHTLQSGFQLFFDTKAEFSSLFEDTTKAELESRCAHHPTNGKNELQIIADKIKNLL